MSLWQTLKETRGFHPRVSASLLQLYRNPSWYFTLTCHYNLIRISICGGVGSFLPASSPSSSSSTRVSLNSFLIILHPLYSFYAFVKFKKGVLQGFGVFSFSSLKYARRYIILTVISAHPSVIKEALFTHLKECAKKTISYHFTHITGSQYRNFVCFCSSKPAFFSSLWNTKVFMWLLWTSRLQSIE